MDVHVTIFLASSSTSQGIPRSVCFFPVAWLNSGLNCIQKVMVKGNASSIKVDQCGYCLFQAFEASSQLNNSLH